MTLCSYMRQDIKIRNVGCFRNRIYLLETSNQQIKTEQRLNSLWPDKLHEIQKKGSNKNFSGRTLYIFLVRVKIHENAM